MPPPVSILFTIPNFITAGSGRAMLNIIERLDRGRFAPGVCVSRKGGALDQTVEQLDIPFMEAPSTLHPKPYATLLSRAWKAGRVFRRHRFQLWHSFHYADDYTESIVARFGGARAWIYTKKNMGWGTRAWKLRTCFASRVAVQNSDMMRDFFGKGSFHEKARMIPRGVDSKQFSPDAAAILAIRSSYNISSRATVATVVAQLVPVKGHPTLLSAVAAVPNLHLLVAGAPMDEAYARSLRGQAEQLGLNRRICFLGGVNDVPALLAETDIFVLPTWAKWRMEGCPVALLEAMACGKACIATDIPGSHDLIDHGRSGLLVPPENVDALAAALRQLADEPEMRRRLGQAARRRVLAQYTIEQEVAAHEALYNEIVSTE